MMMPGISDPSVPVSRLLALGLLVGAATAWSSQLAAEEWTLREQLNQSYAHELISYPFAAKDKACLEDSVAVTGPGGPVAAQISGIEYWPGKRKYVKSARLCLVVGELRPLASQTYTATWGTKKAPEVATDLHVVTGKDVVEITTSHVGLRLPLGGTTYAAPVAARDVPGPMQAMRLGQGEWAGGSRLIGDAAVKAWSARLMDSGPVLTTAAVIYTFADGNVLILTATLVSGDSAVRWDMAVRQDQPNLGVEFRLPPVPGVKQAVLPKGYGQWARDRTQPISPSPEPLAFLSPNSSLVNIFAECPSTIRLAAEGGPEVQIQSRDPGVWADPVAPVTYAGFKTWDLEMIPKMWDVWKRKRIAVSYTADGSTILHASLTKGQRKWSVSAGAPRVGERLDRIKEMVLDWPAAGDPHPRLFLGRQEVQDALTRSGTDPELAKQLAAIPQYAASVLPVAFKPAEKRTKDERDRAAATLGTELAKMGNFDVMRQAMGVAALYDALIDSDLLTPQERALFRAQMAYLGYLMADPGTWSMERGYLSGNPNMSCSYTLSLGVVACVLSDHPMAKTWAEYATAWMDKWLTDEVGPNGEWLPEGSHYGLVSLAPLMSYAVAAKRAGYHDFIGDPRLKKLMLYFAKVHTPRDPQRGDARVSPAFGRGTSGDALGLFGMAARMTAQTDPGFSRTMQWLWTEMGYPVNLGDSRLGGYEGYYLDRRLPAEPPKWTSEVFPNLGALLRSGFATPSESYVNVIACAQSLRNLDIWVPGIGGIAQWYGRGKPLSTCFAFGTGYGERHELLRDGVLLARNWGAADDHKGPFGYYTETKFGAFAALPQIDYVRSAFVITKPDDRDWFPDKLPAYPRRTAAKEGKLDWTRQVLFLKQADPAGPAYLVLRDTTTGGQPTAWQFWSLSEKVGTPEQTRDLATFLADKPGKAHAPARELPPGNRYTAVGQFDVDLDYFIASPANTPRHTLRYGGAWNAVPEYQDLLHLQLPADGFYYVVLYPRPRAEAAPAFSTAADGAVIKVAGAFGTDYALLSAQDATAAAEGVSFRGTAAAVQERPGSGTLSLGAAGEVRWKEYGLVAPGAAALTVKPDEIILTVTPDGPGGPVTLIAPTGWTVKGQVPGVNLEAADGRYRLTVPKGTAAVTLGKGK